MERRLRLGSVIEFNQTHPKILPIEHNRTYLVIEHCMQQSNIKPVSSGFKKRRCVQISYALGSILDCKTVRIFAYSIKYARAVKQKVWNEAENRERDWGETLKIRTVRFAYVIFVRITRFSQPRAIPIG